MPNISLAAGSGPVVEVISSSDEDPPTCVEQKKRGRPPRNSPKFSLEDWVGRERPGVYTFLPEAKALTDEGKEGSNVRKVPLHCNLCNAVFGAQRMSTNHWVLVHEKRDKHQARMRFQGAQTSKAAGQEVGSQIVAGSMGCNGILLGDHSPSDHMKQLARMEDVFRTWWAAGCISLESDGTRHIHCMPGRLNDPGKLVLRSANCKGSQASCLPSGWCLDCNAAMKNRKMLTSVSSWAFKIDASQLHVLEEWGFLLCSSWQS